MADSLEAAITYAAKPEKPNIYLGALAQRGVSTAAELLAVAPDGDW